MQGASLTRSWAARARCGSLRAFRRALESGSLPRWNPSFFLGSYNLPKWSPMESRVGSGGVKKPPKSSSRGTKIEVWRCLGAPRGAQDVPRRLQDAFTCAQDAPRCVQGAILMVFWSQNGAKLTPKSYLEATLF